MVHRYKTTHSRHNTLHGLSFSVEALTLAGIVGGFMVHWVLGLIAILPMILLNGYLKSLLNARATFVFLRKDCGVNVTWDEAYKFQDYFCPNKTGRWLDARYLRKLPEEARRQALLDAIVDFDAKHGKPDGSGIQEETSPNKTSGGDVQ